MNRRAALGAAVTAGMLAIRPSRRDLRLAPARSLGGGSSRSGGPIRFSPDGRCLRFHGSGGLVEWNLADHWATARLPLPDDWPTGWLDPHVPVPSPDWTLLAFAGAGRRSVVLRDARSGRDLAELPCDPVLLAGDGGRVQAIDFSPDGRTLAVATEGTGWGITELTLYDVATRRRTDVFGGASWANAVAAGPDGTVYAAGSGRLLGWDAATGRRVAGWAAGRYGPAGVSVSPDGRQVVTAGEGEIIGWDAATGRRQFTLTHPAPDPDRAASQHYYARSVAHLPGGDRFVSAGSAEVVTIRDAATGEAVRTLTGHTGLVKRVAVSHDGRTVLALAGGFYHPTSRIDPLHNFGFQPIEARVWDLATGGGCRIPVADSESQLRRYYGSLRREPPPASLSPDGRRVVTVAPDGGVRVWSADTGAAVADLAPPPGTEPATDLAFHPDGRHLAGASDRLRRSGGVTDYIGGVVWVWDVNTDRRVVTVEVPTGYGERLTCLAWQPDGRRLLAGTHDGTVRVWSAD